MELDVSRLGQSAPLPPYRAVLAVDMEKFSRSRPRHQQIVGEVIPQVLQEALIRAGMARVWEDARFPRHGGDGYVLGADPEHLPFLLSPFLETLQTVLEEVQPQLAVFDRELRMRLRASIDVGPLPDTGGRSAIDAMGEAMITTHRLLDSDPVKRELATSHPDTTLLAAIISRRVYEDVVLGGFASVNESRWRPVHVNLPDKEYRAEGYLFVPTPSWTSAIGEDSEPVQDGSDRRGAPEDTSQRRPAADQNAAAPGTASSIGTNHGQAIQTGVLNGGVTFGSDPGER
ncbi:hypothetical protein KIK06_04420 [Nocardiopsis sp. EMB25]|uniref:hypothetical protein n=1 Tax=Nocardiopsis sp. EMB25 TaxID=2835867 RepID=UPI002284AFB0|nr:hypothetical protein [Nocardiopsis sp. EMB25]MCY9783134.1 hypothetical protein [Nocardiopsis sp. EMB25]